MDARTADQNLLDLGRLLLEDVCSDLVRFLHSRGDPMRYGGVRIDREYALGPPGAFADLRVEPENEPPYFLEVKYGYGAETIVNHLRRKYGSLNSDAQDARKLVLVIETEAHPHWPALESELRAMLPAHFSLEVWNESRLQDLIQQCFGVAVPSFAPSELITIRERIDQGKERIAFGDAAPSHYAEAALRHNLAWHFCTWRLRELRNDRIEYDLTQLVPPGVYEYVVAVMADLSGFSGYVRSTSDDAVVRQSLTNFYAKSRYQVVNAGGMMDQFVGDEAVAFFGIPDRRPGYLEAAVRTALRLLDIGASVSHDWQRKIDHVQPSGGAHIAMAMGRVQLVSMRAFDHARLAALGDCLNIAGRLLPVAGPGEIVVSNVVRQALSASSYEFVEREPFEAHNVGTIRPWRLLPPAGKPSP